MLMLGVRGARVSACVRCLFEAHLREREADASAAHVVVVVAMLSSIWLAHVRACVLCVRVRMVLCVCVGMYLL